MKIELEISQLSELLSQAATHGATRALEQSGVISNTITLAEVKAKHGKRLANEARKSQNIKWIPVGSGGRTSGVFCKREDFDRFRFEKEFNFNRP